MTALRQADTHDVSAMHVPTVEGFSSGDSLIKGANILQRYPVAGPDLSFGDTKHTPIINPRHLDTVWVHWVTEFRPDGGRNRTSWGPEETLGKLGVRTLHLMSMTRSERDAHDSRPDDALFQKRGAELQNHLFDRGGGHL